MEAPIIEIFSSIQGEGLLIGRRQIFIRFAGCNLDCSYCDTSKSKSPENGEMLSVEEVLKKIEDLKTPDLHSLSFTGGEPLLFSDFINEIMNKTDLKFLLETNGTLPDKIKKLDNIDFVSLDIKLPDHFDNEWNSQIFEKEIESLKILIECNTNIFCKLVVLPSTNLRNVEEIAKRLSDEFNDNYSLSLVIQPSNPISEWQNDFNKLFKFSEVAGKYIDVLIIPQTHKLLNIE